MKYWDVEVIKDDRKETRRMCGETAADVVEELMHNEVELEIRSLRVIKTKEGSDDC